MSDEEYAFNEYIRELTKLNPLRTAILNLESELRKLSFKDALPSIQELRRHFDNLEYLEGEKKKDIKVSEEDIALIIQNVPGCTEEMAQNAMRDNDNDIVNALMSLTGV